MPPLYRLILAAALLGLMGPLYIRHWHRLKDRIAEGGDPAGRGQDATVRRDRDTDREEDRGDEQPPVGLFIWAWLLDVPLALSEMLEVTCCE